MFTSTDVMDNQVLVSLLTPPTAGLLAAAKFHLMTEVVQLSKASSDPSVLVEATFPGYTAKTPTGSGIIRGPTGLLNFTTEPMVWIPSGPGGAEQIVGYWMSFTGANLAGWEYFPQPISLIDNYTSLILVVRISFATQPQGAAETIP